jgi:phage tail sheath gpL-like
LLPATGDGVGAIPVTVYPVADAASGVAAEGAITVSGTQSTAAAYRVVANGIASAEFTIAVSATAAAKVTAIAAAINAALDMPIKATAVTTSGSESVTLAAKWKGLSGNAVRVSVSGSTTAGTTFAITQLSGGLVDPDVTAALAQMGNVWETVVVNCLDLTNTTALDTYQTTGEGRWGALVRKPFVVLTGSPEDTVATAVVVSDARKTDRVNAQIVAPGSVHLPLEIAARAVSRIVKMAESDPAHDYVAQPLTGLIPGADGEQWDSAKREAAVKAGSGTTEVVDGVVQLSDVVTFYHPAGDPTPAYRYVVDLVKLWNTIFNLDLTFASAEWAGAPLIPDGDATVNPNAKQPKMAKAAVNALLDSLGAQAIISDVATAKASTVAAINSSNPKRLDVSTTVQLSGNTNIISVDLNFGFYFGG